MQLYNRKETNRFKKWVDLSMKFGCDDLAYLAIYIQDLGRIDIDLMRRDEEIISDIHAKNRTQSQLIEFGYFLQETQAFSRLWVFQAFEIMRILKERNSENNHLQSLYKTFRRIRIPLAKLEAANGYETDQNIAELTIDRRNGIAWATHEDFIISRQELSDRFLELI